MTARLLCTEDMFARMARGCHEEDHTFGAGGGRAGARRR
jgi:hypothetical protein